MRVSVITGCTSGKTSYQIHISVDEMHVHCKHLSIYVNKKKSLSSSMNLSQSAVLLIITACWWPLLIFHSDPVYDRTKSPLRSGEGWRAEVEKGQLCPNYPHHSLLLLMYLIIFRKWKTSSPIANWYHIADEGFNPAGQFVADIWSFSSTGGSEVKLIITCLQKEKGMLTN